MHVIGVGLGRTGTTSLKAALERLGYGPCFQMRELFARPNELVRWSRAVRNTSIPWGDLLVRYQSSVDWINSLFYQQLAEVFPEAKFILTTRDPDEWYDSMTRTVYATYKAFLPLRRLGPLVSAWLYLSERLMWEGTFDGRFENRQYSLEVFKQHHKRVLASLPPERLLCYDVNEGWDPLCSFLGVKLPREPFPCRNRTVEYWRTMGTRIRIASGAFAGSAAALTCLVLATTRRARTFKT